MIQWSFTLLKSTFVQFKIIKWYILYLHHFLIYIKCTDTNSILHVRVFFFTYNQIIFKWMWYVFGLENLWSPLWCHTSGVYPFQTNKQTFPPVRSILNITKFIIKCYLFFIYVVFRINNLKNKQKKNIYIFHTFG